MSSRSALEIDPSNIALRRELAYLLLEMGKREAAETQFRNIIASRTKTDVLSTAQLGFLLLNRNQVAAAMPLLERALAIRLMMSWSIASAKLCACRKLCANGPKHRGTQTSYEAKTLAERSLEAGYLKDAVKYLRIAHENDPVDFNVMLKLGWAYNMLKDDEQAIEWFRLARRSSDPKIRAGCRPRLSQSSVRPCARSYQRVDVPFLLVAMEGRLHLRAGQDRIQAQLASCSAVPVDAVFRRYTRHHS